jgi:hypothetical protein
MKTYREVEVQLHHSRSRHYMETRGQFHGETALPPGERVPGTHFTEGWVGPRTGLHGTEIDKFYAAGNRTGSFNPQPVAIPTELSRLFCSVINLGKIFVSVVTEFYLQGKY